MQAGNDIYAISNIENEKSKEGLFFGGCAGSGISNDYPVSRAFNNMVARSGRESARPDLLINYVGVAEAVWLVPLKWLWKVFTGPG